MKLKSLMIIGAIASVGFFAFAADAKEHMSEVVKQGSLPAAVQKTIKENTAGGEIVQVRREDDKDGKWNYEVVVKSSGKEWGFEVDPNGKFVRKHDSVAKTE